MTPRSSPTPAASDFESAVEEFATVSVADRVWLTRSVAADTTCGLPPSQMTATQRAFIEEARARYDVVMVDTAPLLAANDASDLLPVTDAVVLACRAGHTTQSAAQRAVEKFERLAAPMAGVVLLGSSGGTTSRRVDAGYLDAAAVRQENGRHQKPAAVAEP